MTMSQVPNVRQETAVEAPARASGTSAGEPGRRRRRLAPRAERTLISTASVAVAFCLWQLAYELSWIDPLYISAPSAIATAAVDLIRDGTLIDASWASLKLFLTGFAISVAIGIPLGVLVGWYPRVSAALDPFISVLYAAPRIALIPLVLIWAGIGFTSQVIIVMLGAVFPVLINTAAGVRSLDRDLVRVARSYGARDIDIFRTLAMPSSLPFITSGLRHAQAYALIGVVVAEFFVGQEGIGKLITDAGLTFKTDVVFVGILVIAAAALILNAVLARFERAVARWRPEVH
jgi:ABC-type nitrate/sulfonate/bicarbonate transport system permease component